MDYNQRKQPVIRAIYDRLFRTAGWLDGTEPNTEPNPEE